MFITELTNQNLTAPYLPSYAVFPESEHTHKLIITRMYEDGYNTLYRMRGLLAMLTARSQATALFGDFQVEDKFSFLNLRELFGFELFTITDGDKFAH